MPVSRARWIFLLGLFVLNCHSLSYAQTGKPTNPADGKKPSTKDSSNKAGSTNQTAYSPNDVIASKVPGQKLLDINDNELNAKVEGLFDAFIGTQSNGKDLLSAIPKSSPADSIPNRSVIVIHAVKWKKSSPKGFQPEKGAWAFCREDNGKFQQDHDLSGTPYLYNAPSIYFVDLNYFPEAPDVDSSAFAYSITTTPRPKQNASDAATLISTILKVSPTTKSLEATVKPTAQVWGASTTVMASSPIPYDLAITATLKAADKSTTPLSCEPSPCSFAKTVTHYDPEYWDISLGVSVPGVLENKFTTTTTNGVTTFKPSPTRHTDAYAFLDVYPFQHYAEAPANLTAFPHFNLGLPITGQSLHRPYVGIAENLGFLTKRIKLNIPLAVFAGPVFMKQQVYVPSITNLKWDHAIKMMYGLELPISSITKYTKGGGSSANDSKSSNSSNNSGN